jgi:transposase-like protein
MAGRKAKWDLLNMPDKLLLIQGWARDGDTEKIICEKLGIGSATLTKWKREYPEFMEALRKGREVIDREVENALLRNALGYEYTEETVTNKGDVVSIQKYQHPNTTAQIFWLKNRKPQEWRDKQQVEHTGKDDGPIQFIAEWGGEGDNK